MSILETVAAAEVTEDEANQIWQLLRDKFGWAGTFFSREDADAIFEEDHDRSLTDAEWEKVTDSYYWRKGLVETITERGWDLVRAAVDDATHERGEE
jgi:hypothetical protein